jgi:SAM-dependent methyltransferase
MKVYSMRECGMIYENPRFKDDTILKGYTESKEVGHDSQYAMRVKSFLRTLRSLSSLLPSPGARVLDIGTAGGGFLEAAERYGYEAVGLEPSRYLVERGTARGLKIQLGTIKTQNFAENSFDLVCT